MRVSSKGWFSHQEATLYIMGRDPVEHAKRVKY